MPSCSLSASSAFSPSARDRQRSRRSSARSASCDKTEILQEKAPGHCDKSRFSTSMKALLKVQPTVRRCSTLRSDKGWTICWILQILLSEAGKEYDTLYMCAHLLDNHCFFTCAFAASKNRWKTFTSSQTTVIMLFYLSGIFLFSTQKYVSKYRTFADWLGF